MVPNTFYTWDDARTVTSSLVQGDVRHGQLPLDVMAQFCPRTLGQPCWGGVPGLDRRGHVHRPRYIYIVGEATFTFQSTPGVPIHPLAFHFGTLRGATVYIDVHHLDRAAIAADGAAATGGAVAAGDAAAAMAPRRALPRCTLPTSLTSCCTTAGTF